MSHQSDIPSTPAKRILVVDDDALVAMGLVQLLEDLGHMVVEAHSGRQALAEVERGDRIDLVITDQSMPGMSGTDLARLIGEIRPELPIMLATGYHDVPEGADLALPRLSKPFDDAEVARAVAGALNGDR